MCDVWWGIVEGEAPRRYEWRGYKELVEMCARCDVTLDVVLSFHACGDSVGDGGARSGFLRGRVARAGAEHVRR